MRFKDLNPRPVKAKYRLYSPTALHNAYKFVVEENISVRRAAKMYGVPTQTLRDRVTGKIEPDCITTGRQPVLSQYEEANLVEHLKVMASYGYGYTLQECVNVATEYAVMLRKRTYDNPLTLRWMEGFRKRWPEIKVTKPRSLEYARAKMASESVVQEYFINLERTLTKYNLTDKPHRIFNVDEKGITLDHKPPYVVSCSDGPPGVTSGKGKNVTLLGCGSAGGVAIPPYFVFPGKRMLPELLKDSLPGADGTVSDSGWSNGVIFRDYLENHFMKYVPGGTGVGSPILLLLDGHKSHVSCGLVEWAMSQNIILFILPAHTSHILQPLDVGAYGPLQKIYYSECHKFMRSTSATICRYNVAGLASKAYSRAMSPENLQSAFRKTGIYPLSMNEIDHTKLIPAEVFCAHDNFSDDSQSTVEGGVNVTDMPAETCFSQKEKELKKTKQKSSQKKARNTMSKVVSGKDLTDNSVLQKMKIHESNQKPSKSEPKLEKKTSKAPRLNTPRNNDPQPGPSCIRIDDDTISSDPEEVDDIPCCVCNMRNPPRDKCAQGLRFVEWAQCDGIKDNNMPCLHWTHLKFCSSIEMVKKEDKFYCPHCALYEE